MALKGVSPAKLSLKWLRESEEGFHHIEMVEKWQQIPGHPGGGVRQDFAGIIDILALGPEGTLAVQTTRVSAWSAHVKKMREHPSTRLLLATPGWRVELHGWAKEKNRWVLKKRLRIVLDQPQQEADEDGDTQEEG